MLYQAVLLPCCMYPGRQQAKDHLALDAAAVEGRHGPCRELPEGLLACTWQCMLQLQPRLGLSGCGNPPPLPSTSAW